MSYNAVQDDADNDSQSRTWLACHELALNRVTAIRKELSARFTKEKSDK